MTYRLRIDCLLAHSLSLTSLVFIVNKQLKKALKAYLTLHDTILPKTYSLVALIALCLEIDDEFEALRVAGTTLTPYAVASRYPGDVSNLSLADSQQALSLAQEVWQFVLSKLPNDISDQFSPD